MQAPLCDECFLRNHAVLPFHFAEKWNGRYFVRSSQTKLLGRVLHLGHGGMACPNVAEGTMPLMLDVVDLNGVRACMVQYCRCGDAGNKWEQLLQIDLFPATVKMTATAFSFSLLKHFDLLSSISKITAMDFVTTIRRTTNNAFPEDVPVSKPIDNSHPLAHPFPQNMYSSFRRVMRVWRALQTRKRAGEYHGMQSLMGGSNDSLLALKCPACPQPGLNMPLKWTVEPSEGDK